MSAKGSDETFELSSKWARTMPLGIVHGIYIEPPPPKGKIKISKLIFDTLMWTGGAEFPQTLMSVKGRDNTFELNPT